MKFTLLDAAGVPRRIIDVFDQLHLQLQLDADPLSVEVVEGAPPDKGMVWNGSLWVDDPVVKLVYAKNNKLHEILLASGMMESSGVSVSGSIYKTDPAAQQYIWMLVTMAELTPGFTTTWELDDGTPVLLDALQIYDVARGIGSHVIEVRDIERTLKGQLAAATTLADVAAIHWPP